MGQLCILGALAPVGDLVQALDDGNTSIHYRNFTEFLITIEDLGDFFHDTSSALQGCAPAGKDIQASAAVLSQLKSVKDIVVQIKQNFHDDDQNNIMMDFEDTVHAFSKKDYGTAGADLGALVHRLLIAAKYPDEV